jgi:hypothetical protein
MADSTRQRMRSEEYDRYVSLAAGARSPAELAQLRAQLRMNWPDDSTAQLLAEVLYDQEQSFDFPDGARAQASAVWHDDPTLLTPPPRRSRRVVTDASVELDPRTPLEPPRGDVI